MREDLLQYIWKFQHFNRSELWCEHEEPLQIIHPGTHNVNQGPDFLQAKIKIGDTIWVGNIEIHVKSSQWLAHGHGDDPHYRNVILHVVWQNDQVITDQNGKELPTVVLSNRVSKIFLEKCKKLFFRSQFIPCENLIPELNTLPIFHWMERVATERLLSKSAAILKMLSHSKGHWEETFWQAIAANFGLKLNADFFLSIAKTLPFSLMVKQKDNIFFLESLLMGQAGLLNQSFQDEYPQNLKNQYTYLKKKLNLVSPEGSCLFLRMRPAAFPTIRLAQLAGLIHQNEHFFSKAMEIKSVATLRELLRVKASEYWDTHYVFDQQQSPKKKHLGKQMIDNLIINTVVPSVFAYGTYYNDDRAKERALKWLEEIPPELNHITKEFSALGFLNLNAMQSQSLLELKKEYCDQKKCLHCGIGHTILKKEA